MCFRFTNDESISGTGFSRIKPDGKFIKFNVYRKNNWPIWVAIVLPGPIIFHKIYVFKSNVVKVSEGHDWSGGDTVGCIWGQGKNNNSQMWWKSSAADIKMLLVCGCKRLTEEAEHFGCGGNPPGALGQRRKFIWFCWKQASGDELQEALYQLSETPCRQSDTHTHTQIHGVNTGGLAESNCTLKYTCAQK